MSHHVTHIVICKIYRNLLNKKIRKLRKNKKKNRNNNILSGKHVTLKTRQTRATSAGFWGVTICQPAPAPAPVTTRDCNPARVCKPVTFPSSSVGSSHQERNYTSLLSSPVTWNDIHLSKHWFALRWMN